jgi:hypothetical protein
MNKSIKAIKSTSVEDKPKSRTRGPRKATGHTETVSFSVEGEYLTELSRNLVVEGKWEKALLMLKTGLHGISTDQVISILSGEYKLTGVNDVIMQRDSQCPEYLEKLRWKYLGYIQARPPAGGESWYQPYAVVTDYGQKDLTDDEDESDSMNVFTSTARALHYADKNSDLAANLNMADNSKAFVLFAMVESPPFWMVDELKANATTPQQALSNYERQERTLKTRGHEAWYGDEETESDESESDTKDKRTQNRNRWLGKVDEPDYSKLVDQIKKQTGDNWIEFKAGNRTLRVPRAPFEHWCLSRTSGIHLAMPWTVVSPVGLKMVNDDPYHTDWILGAGLPVDCMNWKGDEEIIDAANAARHKMQAEKLDFKCAVLCGTGRTERVPCIHAKEDDKVNSDAIVILPNSSPKWLPLISQIVTGAVIVEKGGAMAHLVNVSRPREGRIVMVENARKLYPNGVPLIVDCDSGEVSIMPYVDCSIYNPWTSEKKNKP